MPAPSPSRLLASLDSTQRKIITGRQAQRRRAELIYQLWRRGMSQGRIAEHLSKVSASAGGDEVTTNAVFKIVRRHRLNGEPGTAPGERN